MKILGINGSPRNDGNTAYAIKYYLDQFERENYDIQLVNIEDLQIIPCKGCMLCRIKKDGHCVLEDQSSDFYGIMCEADIIVLASPVYIGSITPQLLSLLVKSRFLDRSLRRFEGKIGVPIVVGRRAGHNFALSQLLHFFSLSGMTVTGSKFWNVLMGNKEKDSVTKDSEGIRNLQYHAENLKKLVKGGNIFESSSL